MSRPRYRDVPAATIPVVERADGTRVRVVAGEVDGVRGPVTDIYAEPEYLDVALPAGCSFDQPVPRGHSAFAYVFAGEAEFGDGADLGYQGDLNGALVDAPASGRLRRRRRRARQRRLRRRSASCSSQGRRSASRSRATGPSS